MWIMLNLQCWQYFWLQRSIECLKGSWMATTAVISELSEKLSVLIGELKISTGMLPLSQHVVWHVYLLFSTLSSLMAPVCLVVWGVFNCGTFLKNPNSSKMVQNVKQICNKVTRGETLTLRKCKPSFCGNSHNFCYIRYQTGAIIIRI